MMTEREFVQMMHDQVQEGNRANREAQQNYSFPLGFNPSSAQKNAAQSDMFCPPLTGPNDWTAMAGTTTPPPMAGIEEAVERLKASQVQRDIAAMIHKGRRQYTRFPIKEPFTDPDFRRRFQQAKPGDLVPFESKKPKKRRPFRWVARQLIRPFQWWIERPVRAFVKPKRFWHKEQLV